jgi:molybdopterin-containing oxidoreductase family membrane subunit
MNTFVTKWEYFPSSIEVTIFLGVLAFMCFVVLLAIDRLPIAGEVEA